MFYIYIYQFMMITLEFVHCLTYGKAIYSQQHGQKDNEKLIHVSIDYRVILHSFARVDCSSLMIALFTLYAYQLLGNVANICHIKSIVYLYFLIYYTVIITIIIIYYIIADPIRILNVNLHTHSINRNRNS